MLKRKDRILKRILSFLFRTSGPSQVSSEPAMISIFLRKKDGEEPVIKQVFNAMNIKRNISSDYTYPTKYLFFGLFLLGISGIFDSSTKLIDDAGLCLVAFYIGFRFAWLPKIVSVDSSFLYVSDYRREILIPLSDIDRVRQTFFMKDWGGGVQQVTIILRHPSEFGRKIIFFPEDGLVYDIIFETHPIVDQLNRLIHSHKQKMRENSTEE